MKGFLDLLFAPILPFLGYPERAYIAGLVFLVFVLTIIVIRRRDIRLKELKPLLAAFVAWELFGLNEYAAHVNKTDLRIELLIIGPFIMALSVFAFYGFVKSLLSR